MDSLAPEIGIFISLFAILAVGLIALAADLLKGKWMGDALDMGDPEEGKKWDAVEDIACPRCGKDMEKGSDPKQPHIWYEFCSEHGMFMDAGEFTDFKHETLGDWFRSLIKGSR